MKITVRFPLLLVLLLSVAPAAAQELTPRSYWPAPKGTRIGLAGYVYTYGDVVTDPSLPVIGVDSKLNRASLGYAQTLDLWGRTSNLIVEVPVTWGSTEGTLMGQPVRRDLQGVGDISLTLSVNLLGAPSLTPVEFQELRRHPRQILGASIKVVAPTGDYDDDRLLNVGTNRWAVKGELGYIVPITPKWLLELEAGAWFIGDNDDFLGGTREQDPIFAGQLHVVRRIRPAFWLALDVNYYTGGRSTINGVLTDDLQRNSRLGLTFAHPVGKRNLIKAQISRGVVTESGGDFKSLLILYARAFR